MEKIKEYIEVNGVWFLQWVQLFALYIYKDMTYGTKWLNVVHSCSITQTV